MFGVQSNCVLCHITRAKYSGDITPSRRFANLNKDSCGCKKLNSNPSCAGSSMIKTADQKFENQNRSEIKRIASK